MALLQEALYKIHSRSQSHSQGGGSANPLGLKYAKLKEQSRGTK